MAIVIPVNEAIAGMALLRSTTLLSSKHLTRLLREDGRGLWPQIGSGRRAATVSVGDVINLWMASILSDGQISDSPRVVHEFHLLRVMIMDEFEQSDVNDAESLQLSARRRLYIDSTHADESPLYLANQLQRLIEQTALEIIAGRPFKGELTDWPEICITLGGGVVPMVANVTWHDKADKGESKFSVDQYRTNINALVGNWPFPERPNKLSRTQILIGQSELLAVANFVASIGKIEADSNSPTAPGSVEKGNTTPETQKASGTGIHEGLLSERPAPKAQTVAPDKAQHATGKGRKQSPQPPNAVSGAGQKSTPDRKGVKRWTSRSVSPKARVACSDMFERLTA